MFSWSSRDYVIVPVIWSHVLFLGLHFKLDPSSSPHRELVFSRDLTIAKLTNPVSCVVLGDVSLTTGRHYWKVRVDQFQGATSYSGYVAVGIATTAVQASLLGK